jgi:hypothetical protein
MLSLDVNFVREYQRSFATSGLLEEFMIYVTFFSSLVRIDIVIVVEKNC